MSDCFNRYKEREREKKGKGCVCVRTLLENAGKKEKPEIAFEKKNKLIITYHSSVRWPQ